ncbi:MAG: hypothetical protein GXO39_04040 [Thermotogae bacterium]|nr:hypothetical protein [Thermotogota bacterium]
MLESLDEYLQKEGVILPKGFVVEVYAQILRFAGGLSGLLQVGSKKAGISAAKTLAPYINHSDAAKNLKELIEEFFKRAGFGSIKAEVFDDKLVLEVEDSFLLRAHKKPEVALKPLVGAAEGFIGEILKRKTKAKVEGTRITIELK